MSDFDHPTHYGTYKVDLSVTNRPVDSANRLPVDESDFATIIEEHLNRLDDSQFGSANNTVIVTMGAALSYTISVSYFRTIDQPRTANNLATLAIGEMLNNVQRDIIGLMGAREVCRLSEHVMLGMILVAGRISMQIAMEESNRTGSGAFDRLRMYRASQMGGKRFRRSEGEAQG